MEKDKEILDNEEVLNEDEMLDEISTTIILNDESGNEVEFEFLEVIPYQDKEYIILLPIEEEEKEDEEAEVVILEYEEGEDGEELYSGVIDEEVLDAVFNIFKERWADHFNFAD